MRSPCRITDEQVYNPWEEPEKKEINKLKLFDFTLEELASQEFYTLLSIKGENGYTLFLEGYEDEEIILDQDHITQKQIDNIERFCKMFLNQYAIIKKQK